MATWETVQRILAGFPETSEGTSYRTPAFRLRKRLVVRLREDGDSLVVHTGVSLRAALLGQGDRPFFTLPHYDREGSPYVLVRLGQIDDAELRDVLTDAWLINAPISLADRWQSGQIASEGTSASAE